LITASCGTRGVIGRTGGVREGEPTKAVVWTRYGSPENLQLREVIQPVPRSKEVLIRIRATAVTAGDCELRALRFSIVWRVLVRMAIGLTRPRDKILGQELAGDVVAVGRDVTRFGKGDPIFGTTGFRFGAYAEYICLPELAHGSALSMKPANMSYEEAATVPTGGLEALHFLRRAGDLHDRKVLILGAGGGIGIFAVQLAKYFGAAVTGVDRGEKRGLVLSLGAERFMDYLQEDFSERDETFDVIFDVVGNTPFSAGFSHLSVSGRYLLGNPRLTTRFRGWWSSCRGGKQVVQGAAQHATEDLDFLRALIDLGGLRTVIDRQFSLEGIPDAHRYFESGLARGRIVIGV
jgi:NADPH:quinone reductase-like Zn-dependent oxidoreductase